MLNFEIAELIVKERHLQYFKKILMTPVHFLASEYRRVIVQSVFGDLVPSPRARVWHH